MLLTILTMSGSTYFVDENLHVTRISSHPVEDARPQDGPVDEGFQARALQFVPAFPEGKRAQFHLSDKRTITTSPVRKIVSGLDVTNNVLAPAPQMVVTPHKPAPQQAMVGHIADAFRAV